MGYLKVCIFLFREGHKNLKKPHTFGQLLLAMSNKIGRFFFKFLAYEIYKKKMQLKGLILENKKVNGQSINVT